MSAIIIPFACTAALYQSLLLVAPASTCCRCRCGLLLATRVEEHWRVVVVRLSLMLTTAMLEVIVLLLLSSSVAMVQGMREKQERERREREEREERERI